MTYETYRTIFMIAGGLCGSMFAVTVILFFLLRIPAVIGDLSGSTARKAIQDIREKNERSGNEARRPGKGKRRGSRLTDKISASGRIVSQQQASMELGTVTAKIRTQQLGTQTEETTVLQPHGDAGRNAGGFAGETDVLVQQAEKTAAFEIEFDITYVHTGETIGD